MYQLLGISPDGYTPGFAGRMRADGYAIFMWYELYGSSPVDVNYDVHALAVRKAEAYVQV